MKILIVEDENDSRIFLERRLQKEGCTVFSAENGVEALEISQESKPDVVISDIMMPEMDGFELCRRMKADEQLRTIPFLFYTATFLDRKDEQLAMALGGERFIVKPIEIERLLEIIAEVLEKHKEKMLSSPGETSKSEEELTSMYVERISRKLEKKVKELEAEHAALVRSEEKYHRLFEFSRDGICVVSMHGELLDFNQQFIRFTKRTKDELLSMRIEDLFPNTPTPFTETRIQKMLQGEDVDLFEAVLQSRNGDEIPVEINVTKLENCYGRDFVFQGSVRDITERKMWEEKLKASEKLLTAIVENIPDMIFVKDAKTLDFVRFNKAGEDLVGYAREEMIGKNDYDFFPKEEADFFTTKDREVLQKGKLVDIGEETIQTKYRGERTLHTIKVPLLDENRQPEHLLGISRDITHRKQTEKERRELEFQLRQAQKMEAIGTLAGGIAHDFNNILSAIFGYSELLKDDLKDDKNAYRMLEQVLNAADRAKDLVNQILLFSRQTEQKMRPVQPHLVVKEALKLLRASIPSTIEIKSQVQTACGRILADPTQLHQIVMNLCTNSYHAMGGKSGIIGLSLSDIKITKDDITFGNLDLDIGRYIRLEVSDTGHGMDTATMEQMFNPYFTTKPKGEGTGLGLSVVHGIVKNFGGRIKVYSEKEKGTSIHIYFPRIDIEESDVAEKKAGVIPGGHERILVVDDEPSILKMNQIILENLGYRVTCFENAGEALKTFSENPDQFDLILTDLTMPEMTGLELIERIFHVKPDMPTVLCTGFSELISQEQAEALNIKEFLTKPVLRIDLARALRRIFD